MLGSHPSSDLFALFPLLQLALTDHPLPSSWVTSAQSPPCPWTGLSALATLPVCLWSFLLMTVGHSPEGDWIDLIGS